MKPRAIREEQFMMFCFLRNRFVLSVCLATFIASSVTISQSDGQTTNRADRTTTGKIQSHLDAGEFPLAIKLASTLPKDQNDKWLGQISQTQLAAGSPTAAFDSAGQITNDLRRSSVLSSMSQTQSGNADRGPNANGSMGGVTEQDFTPLIDLITGTIASESWLDTGTGLGTIQAYPAGVFVDSSGTLKKLKIDAKMSSREIRSLAISDSGNRRAQWPADLRTISLTRLEREAQLLAAQGRPLDEEMANLAGMTEIKYVIAYPESGDIVIAGPAGPWKKDKRNRSVNVDSGKPVLQLDDLVVCLRNAWGNNGKFGCAITPRQKNLAATQNFLATSKLKGKKWSRQLREVLGKQDVEVFGIDARTHASRILVEADYRMKLIGMGLEPSVPGVASYLDRIKLNPDGSLPPMDVVRWWFTLNYDDVVSDADRMVFTFNGSGVKVLSENELLDEQGKRIHTGQSHGPTKAFARDFTKHFEKIATQYPIYRELKNVFDMALVSSLIRHQDLAKQVNWNLTYFGSEHSPNQLTYKVRHEPVARQVNSVMNQRVLKFRKPTSTVKHTLVGVSGGISYDAHEVMSAERIKTETDSKLANETKRSRPQNDQTNWWWD
jgi:hypothetical protein